MITRCKDCNRMIAYGLDDLFKNPELNYAKMPQATMKDFTRCLKCYEKLKVKK